MCRRVIVTAHCGSWLTPTVTPDQIEQIRPRLVEFAGQMLGELPRSDQRAKGELYVRGLLTDGARKSMQPMAERLGVDHQGLQQFITSSTWDYERVRATVANWVVDTIAPDAYVVDDSGFVQGRQGLAVRGPPVLRHPEQNRELPDRGERADGHRFRVAGGELTAVLPAILG